MTLNFRPVALLDACVIYPAPIRDLLLNMADFRMFLPKWTDKIHEEWIRSLLANRSDLQRDQLQKTCQAMNEAFPEATVSHYLHLLDSIDLPDRDDRHIVAAAVHSKAEVIVTNNLKDFPLTSLNKFDLQAQHPDIFIYDLMNKNPDKALKAFQQQVSNLRKPPMKQEHVIENLRNVGLGKTAEFLTGMM